MSHGGVCPEGWHVRRREGAVTEGSGAMSVRRPEGTATRRGATEGNDRGQRQGTTTGDNDRGERQGRATGESHRGEPQGRATRGEATGGRCRPEEGPREEGLDGRGLRKRNGVSGSPHQQFLQTEREGLAKGGGGVRGASGGFRRRGVAGSEIEAAVPTEGTAAARWVASSAVGVTRRARRAGRGAAARPGVAIRPVQPVGHLPSLGQLRTRKGR